MPTGASGSANASTLTNANQPGATQPSASQSGSATAQTTQAGTAPAVGGTQSFSQAPAATAALGANVNAAGAGIAANTAARIGTALGLTWAQNAANALTIGNVAQGTPFGQIGFVPGDQLVSIGGQTLATPADFAQYVTTVQPGQRIPIVVMRNGVQQTLYWTPNQAFLQTLPQMGNVTVVAQQQGHYLGLRLDDRIQQAAVVAEVVDNSPAQQAGLQPGDVITAVNRQPVGSPAEFMNAVAQVPPNDAVQLSFNRSQDVQLSPIQRTGAVAPAVPVTPAPAVVVPGRTVPVGPAPVRRIFRGRP